MVKLAITGNEAVPYIMLYPINRHMAFDPHIAPVFLPENCYLTHPSNIDS